MGAQSEETKDEVKDVVDNLRVGANLSDTPLERTGIAHNTQQMDALQRHLSTNQIIKMTIRIEMN